MSDGATSGFWIFLIVIASVWAISQSNGKVDDCRRLIAIANDRIEQLNVQVRDANDTAWSDYSTMGQKLSDLTVESPVVNYSDKLVNGKDNKCLDEKSQ